MRKTIIYNLLALLICFSTFSYSQAQTQFDKKWETVDSLQKKGLYRMALNEVNSIFDQASQQKVHTQVIKSVLFELKYNAYLEEEDYILGIARLDSLIDVAPSPSKEILHSLSAEVYWGYYNSNSWKFQDRTNVVEVDLNDVRTWDLKRIAKKVRDHYLLSLKNGEISKKEDIKNYKDIASYTENEETGEMRPTLFDFLAHRALDFFKSNSFNVPGPAETYVIEDDRFFGSNSTFLGANNFSTTDSLNSKFYAVKIFAELTKFHTSVNNKNALFSIELERLLFMSIQDAIPGKEKKFYSGLERLAQAYQNEDYVSEAWYEMARFHADKGSFYQAFGDTTNRWEKKIALEICNKTIKQYPDVYGSQQCEALKNVILTKVMNIKGEHSIPSNQKSRFLLEYKNTSNLHYKIVKYDYKKYNESRYNYYDLAEFLQKAKAIHYEEVKIIDPEDFQQHSTEIMLPEVENGFYFIVTSSNANFAGENEALAYFPFWSSDITYQFRNEKGLQNVLVTNRKSGEPLEAAKVTVSYEKYNYLTRAYEHKTLGHYNTDDQGKFNFTPDEDYYNYFFKIVHDNEVYAPVERSYAYYYDYNDYSNTVTQFFTDRKIYRPGQTIFFKGIMMDYTGEKRELKANYSSTVYFYDVNSQEIGHQTVKTNEFGSFQGEFTAPFGVLTGQMRIQDAWGSTYFRVEEYKRPKFNVEMKPVEGEFMVNDEIEVTGIAKAFAGNFIDGADVKYRVTRSTSFNSWYYWWYWRPYEAAKEISNGITTTDENGELKIKFNALPDKTVDPKDLPLFLYTITVDVTDINGETHSATTSVTIGYQSLMLSNNLKAEMNGDRKEFLRISTTNLSGQKIEAKGSIKISKLKSPDSPLYSRLWQQPDLPVINKEKFKSAFPNHVYENENSMYLWKDEKTVLNTTFDTKVSDSIVLKNYAKWGPGMYKYEANSKDKNGIPVKDVRYFTLYKNNSDVSATNEVLWIKELKTTVEPGDKAEILIATAEENIRVFYDVELKNKIVESNSFILSKEQKKLDFTVNEIHRGNFTVHFSTLKNNRHFNKSITVIVPHTNKELDLSFSTFRNKLLPGEEEEWTMTIKNAAGEKEMAELLATLYDASLDELYTPNSFYMNIYTTYYGNLMWGAAHGITTSQGNNVHSSWNNYVYYPGRYFPVLNYHGYNYRYYGRNSYNYGYDYYEDADDGVYYSMDLEISETEELNAPGDMGGRKNKEGAKKVLGGNNRQDNTATLAASTTGTGETSINGKFGETLPPEEQKDLSGIQARSNFNETAFFYPQLKTDENGNVKISFTIPESLTKWKFSGLAHTKDLKIGTISEEVVTQKDLMVVPNAPRFLREGDKITISSKVSNISEKDLKGAIQLDLIDPFTEKAIDTKFKHKDKQLSFEVKAGKSTSVSWTIDVPYETSAVKYRIVAAAGDFSDGEESVLPILSNRMLVTESMPMPIRGNQSKTFSFDKLKNSNSSKTLKHHRYTVEFTSNPAWYALQAMPYMMEYPYECAEQTFTRYYSNAIATHVMNSNPKIQTIIDKWGEESPDAFLSNLQKNQELKSVMLEETPWVLNAKSEAQTKKNLSILLDMNRMSKELDKALGKTINNQSANGGFPWFPGMKESRYITQHIMTGMGHLDHLGIKDIREDRRVWNMIKKGINYLDGEIVSDYKSAKRWDPNYLINQHIGYNQIQYLYARSYFTELPMNKSTQEAVGYYKDQAIKFWLTFNIYGEGMLALAAHRFEMTGLATDIVKSLKDRSIQHEEFGMYWKDYQVGYYWYQAPIETQALMIEMFDEVVDDQASVDELKIWLLKQKQTTHWKTTKQTTESVYALLLKGSDLLASDKLVEVLVGGDPIEYVEKPEKGNPYQVKAEAGTGYFKTAWTENQVKPKMGDVKITKNDKGVAWGAAYWQYFEDLDKITFAETNLKLEKKLFLVDVANEGEQLKPVNEKNVLKVGEKVRVRIELRTDRNLEYVHMKDMRASGFEPINVLSRYHYQDGLGYYQATKDAATNFFFDYIPKGTYVFEYDLRVQHKGNFSNGITTIQCMYAPEFTSHSEGIRVNVE